MTIQLLAEPGTPATYGIGGDRYPMVVISATPATLKAVSATVAEDGTVTPDSDGAVREFRLKKGNVIRPTGANYGHLHLGKADDYRDPSF